MDGLAAIEQALATAVTAGPVARDLAATRGGRRSSLNVGPLRRPHEAGLASSAPGTTEAAATGGFLAIPAGYRPFSVGALGNFPYYWQDPATLLFNTKTYQWIAAGLKAGSNPVQLDGFFTNRFIRLLGSISYGLSTADQAQLDRAQATATNEQRALLQAWRSAFGALPGDAAGSPVINLIMEEIACTWASPATDLNTLSAAADPSVLLNRTPPAGQSVLSALCDYLAAIKSSVPLLNEVTRNSGLLSRALTALQDPTTENGALMLSDRSLVPAYAVQTPVHDILAGLAMTTESRTVRLALDVKSGGIGAHEVAINGGVTARVPTTQILGLGSRASNDILGSILSVGGAQDTVRVTADFPGVTTVCFAPCAFLIGAFKNWFWTEPIIQAVRNGKNDVSGFKFTPDPPFDLSEEGPVGCVTSVIISRNPSIKVATSQPLGSRLADAVTSTPGGELSFLGRSLGTLGAADGYELAEVRSTPSEQVTLRPVPNLGSGVLVDARAWVLAVKTEFLVPSATIDRGGLN